MQKMQKQQIYKIETIIMQDNRVYMLQKYNGQREVNLLT